MRGTVVREMRRKETDKHKEIKERERKRYL